MYINPTQVAFMAELVHCSSLPERLTALREYKNAVLRNIAEVAVIVKGDKAALKIARKAYEAEGIFAADLKELSSAIEAKLSQDKPLLKEVLEAVRELSSAETLRTVDAKYECNMEIALGQPPSEDGGHGDDGKEHSTLLGVRLPDSGKAVLNVARRRAAEAYLRGFGFKPTGSGSPLVENGSVEYLFTGPAVGGFSEFTAKVQQHLPTILPPLTQADITVDARELTTSTSRAAEINKAIRALILKRHPK